MTREEADKLLAVREIAEELERLEDGLEELKRRTISSPNMDGMPHGSSQGDALPAALIRMQDMEDKLGRTSERLRRAQNAARRIIRQLPVVKRIFYEAYYVEHDKHDAACRVAGISESTGYRYMRQLGDKG